MKLSKYWVGVKNRPPQTVFIDNNEEHVNTENYPQYAYCVGPFATRKEADKYSKSHVNLDGTFTDPFCNKGRGR